MRALDAYQGSFVVCAAVRFTALTFVRQVELRFATWDEIDWEERMWLIPAERMKMRREHMVPLSRQALLCWRRCGASMGRSLTSLRGRGGGDADQ